MGMGKKDQTFAYTVIKYYETKARRSKSLVYRAFKHKSRSVIHRILKRYLEKGQVTYTYNLGGDSKNNQYSSLENVKKLKRLLELDPYISTQEISHVLEIPSTNSVKALKKRLTDLGFQCTWSKPEETEDAEKEEESAGQALDERTEAEGTQQQQEQLLTRDAEQVQMSTTGEPAQAEPSTSHASMECFPKTTNDTDMGVDAFFDDFFQGGESSSYDNANNEPQMGNEGSKTCQKMFEPVPSTSSSIPGKSGAERKQKTKAKVEKKQQQKPKPKEKEVIYIPCIVCDKTVKLEDSKPNADGETNQSHIEENAKVIFILKHLLDLTSSQIQGIMQESDGKDPKEWIGTCNECSKAYVQEALNIRKEIKNLEAKLEECKTRMEDGIRTVVRSKPNRRRRTKKLDITSKVRGMVFDREVGGGWKPPNISVFARGDELAKSLAQQLMEIQAKIEIKEEPQSDGEFENSEFDSAAFVDDNDFIGGDLHNDDGNDETLGTDFKATKVADYDDDDELEDFDYPVRNKDDLEDSDFDPDDEVPKKKKASSKKKTTKGEPEEPQNEGGRKHLPITKFWDPRKVSMVENFSEREKEIAETYRSLNEPFEAVTCDVCEEVMRPVTLPMHKLKKHKIVMTGYTVMKCTNQGCNYQTLHEELFQIHRKRHVKEGTLPFSCQFCGKGFNRKITLRYHEEAHKNADTKPFQCDICGASFAVKKYLAQHKSNTHQRKLPPSAVKRLSKATKARLAIPDPVEEVLHFDNAPAPVPAPATTTDQNAN